MASYPPPGHFLGELQIEFPRDRDPSVDWRRDGVVGAPLEATMVAHEGLSYDGITVPLGVLATFVDLVAGRISAGAAQPDWVATSDLAVSQLRPLPLEPLWARGRVVRAGKNLVTSSVEIGVKGEAAPAALATSAFGRLGGNSRGAGKPKRTRPSLAESEPSPQGGELSEIESPPKGPLLERLGLEVSPEGVVTTTLRDYTSNSLGALQGGVAAMMYERAALETARAAGTTPGLVTELAVRYLSLGREGPFQTAVEAETTSADASVLRLSIGDLGAVRDGAPRLLSLASVRVDLR